MLKGFFPLNRKKSHYRTLVVPAAIAIYAQALSFHVNLAVAAEKERRNLVDIYCAQGHSFIHFVRFAIFPKVIVRRTVHHMYRSHQFYHLKKQK
jgi:hypothetical protein